MKKIILMAAIAALSLNLVACSGESNATQKETNTKTESSQSESETVTSAKAFLGQVSNKVGNDITLSLGKFVVDNNDTTTQTFIYDGTGDPKPYDGDSDSEGTGEVLMIPAPDDESGDGENSTSTSPIEKMPIEFTGEVRDFTIPAGVKITNVLGKEVNFDAIEKGSLVQIIVNEGTGVVEKLMVW